MPTVGIVDCVLIALLTGWRPILALPVGGLAAGDPGALLLL